MKIMTTFGAEEDVKKYLDAQKKLGMKVAHIINEGVRMYQKKKKK